MHTVKVFDTSNERKTAENLLKEMIEVMQILGIKWKVEVVAMCSDAAGESKKARSLLLAKFPALIGPDCWAHQVSFEITTFYIKIMY